MKTRTYPTQHKRSESCKDLSLSLGTTNPSTRLRGHVARVLWVRDRQNVCTDLSGDETEFASDTRLILPACGVCVASAYDSHCSALQESLIERESLHRGDANIGHARVQRVDEHVVFLRHNR